MAPRTFLSYPDFGRSCAVPADLDASLYAFFSETTNIIKAKLYMNVHWMVLYQIYLFCSDMKFKMAATAGRSRHFEFHIGTKNVKFVEDHPMTIHVQFGFNHICSF
jgi:hypothetical protein